MYFCLQNYNYANAAFYCNSLHQLSILTSCPTGTVISDAAPSVSLSPTSTASLSPSPSCDDNIFRHYYQHMVAQHSHHSFNQSEDKSISASVKYKTELCHAFEELGRCSYGIKCQFAHGISELKQLAHHPKYKSRLCHAFHTTGFCRYGKRCHYIHNEDVRPPFDNVPGQHHHQRPRVPKKQLASVGGDSDNDGIIQQGAVTSNASNVSHSTDQIVQDLLALVIEQQQQLSLLLQQQNAAETA